MKDGVTSKVMQFVAMKEEVTAAEIAAFLVSLVRDEFGLDEPTYDKAAIGKPVVWRGATSYARDIIKRPGVVEEMLEEEEEETEEQGDLFPGLGAFVRVDHREGTWRFKRRRSLTREEYVDAMKLLRETSRKLTDKIERYQGDFDKAEPFWTPGLTFGEAITLAAQGQ